MRRPRCHQHRRGRRRGPTQTCAFCRVPDRGARPGGGATLVAAATERAPLLARVIPPSIAARSVRRSSSGIDLLSFNSGPLLETRARRPAGGEDRKSTRLNSSHLGISYAVFCLKKKK